VSRHTVRLKNIVVGWSDLEVAEPELGRARGRFRPGVGYDLVQPVFQLFADAAEDPEKLERYHRSRDALGLSLEDDKGREIHTSAIHIVEGSTLEMEVLISDRDYWTKRAIWKTQD
jgi:hypothetical protein